MRKKYILPLITMLIIVISFSGCKKKVELQNVGTAMTVGELKNTYDVSAVFEQNELAPFWNVEQNTVFTFHFNSKVEPALAISVHTDPKCGPNSRVGQLNAAYLCDSGVDVVVKPGAAVLSDTENQSEAAWGNAPIYFLRINYDRFSEEVTELEQPVIVPFTVKNEVSTPTLEGRINNQGQFYLTWTPVDKAVGYEIYESGVGLNEEDQEPLQEYTRSELGYVGDHLEKIGETEGTTFEDFSYNGSKKNYMEISGDVTNQNAFLPLTYFVRAKDKDGNYGNYSMAVESWKFAGKLPESTEIQAKTYTALPETAEVKMKDGSITNMPVNFKMEGTDTVFDEKSSKETERGKYSYTIPGTLLTGYVYLLKGEEEFPEEQTSTVKQNFGIYNVKNSKSIIPEATNDVLSESQKQIITPDEERQLTTYSSDMRMAVAEMENVRLLNDGIYQTQIEELVKKYGSIYGGDVEPQLEPSTPETTDEIPELSSEDEESKEQAASEETKKEEASDETTTDETPELSSEDEKAEEQNTSEKDSQNVSEEKEDVSDETTETPSEDKERPANPDIGDANNSPVPVVHVRMFADSAEEEYLARMLITAQESIDLKAFPRLQDPTHLIDVIEKVVFQNPYIMSVRGYSYDPSSRMLNIEYSLSAEEIVKRQKEMQSATSSILSSCITEGMTDEEKALAVWNKLEDDTSYDDEALKAAQENEFQSIDASHTAAFDAYGIMCKKKGVCQSYALTYKLLLNEAGVNTMVLTGFMDQTLPHAWDVVNIEGKWYWYDVTNNAKTSRIPYMLFEASPEEAEKQSYKTDERYDIDSNLGWADNSDDNHNFYYKNKLIADSAKDIPNKIKQAYEMKRHGCFAVYTKDEISPDQMEEETMAEIIKSLLEAGMKKEEIQRLKIAGYKNFIVFLEK